MNAQPGRAARNWPGRAANVQHENAAGAGITAKVTTRRAAVRRPREHDTGHVVTGIGYAFECSCGARGPIRNRWRLAMHDGREHAAGHGRTGADTAGAR